MKVAIHQPNFMPWRGWFAKLMQADVMVLLDDVQFEKGGWTNRVRVWDDVLTVPVNATEDGAILPIKDVDVAPGGRWRRKMRETLRHKYGKSPGWERIEPWFSETVHNVLGEERLTTLNVRLLDLMADAFDILTPMVWASQFREQPEPGTAGLVQILKTYNADEYICGRGAWKYQDDEMLAAEGITVSMARYQQDNGRPDYGLTALDVIAQHPDSAPEQIRAFAV